MPSSTLTDPKVLDGWGARGYNWEYTVSGQHQLAPRVAINGGWYRRSFGNQTVTVDNRYNFANNSFDGPFCVNAPVDANLPNGGGYQVCGLYDLKPSVVAQNLPANSTIHFSSDYGGETNIYEGFEVSTTARFAHGAFFNVGINAQKRIFDQCNLVNAGIVSALTTAATEVAEIFPDGTKACHQDLPYRPDLKLLGSYTLPYEVVVSATYQFSRGVQTGGAAPSILATWTGAPASATTLGRAYSAGADDQEHQPDGGRAELRQPEPAASSTSAPPSGSSWTSSGSVSTSTPTTSSTATGRSRSAARSPTRRPATG